MIIKKVLLLLLILCLINRYGYTQISTELKEKFSPAVMYRVYLVLQKTHLPVQKQLALAKYFKDQDSVALTRISQGQDLNIVMKSYGENERFKTIMSPLEFLDYKFIDDNSTSQITKALHYRDLLKLDNYQVKNLTDYLNKINNYQSVTATSPELNTYTLRQVEGHELMSVLDLNQYSQFLQLSAQSKARDDNEETWNLIKRFKLAENQDTTALLRQNYNYFIKKNANEFKALNSKSPEKADSVRKYYEMIKPIILFKLDGRTNKLTYSQFSVAIKYAKELKLLKPQIDTLYADQMSLEEKRSHSMVNNKVTLDTKKFETEKMLKLLTGLQYNKFLWYKNIRQAQVNCGKDFNKLQQYGLLVGQDSLKLSKGIYKYELNLLVTKDRVTDNDTEENVFLKKDAELTKPDILKQLDAALKGKEAEKRIKGSFTW